MQWKLAAAFAAGAVLASGIVFFAVRPTDVHRVDLPAAPASKRAAKIEPIQPRPHPIPAIQAPPLPAPVTKAPSSFQPTIVREKRSAMPAPVRRSPPLIAKTVAPPPPLIQPVPTPASSEPPPAPAPVTEAPAPPPAPPAETALPPTVETRVPHVVTLTAGTVLPVRIGESLSAAKNRQGDRFLATLTQPLVIDGWIIAERGARAEGRIVEMAPPGRASIGSHMGISIVRLATADGQNIHINTDHYIKEASAAGADAAKIGGGAALGAILGAVFGGGKGAAIWAGAGGAVGAGDVLLTRGKAAEIPVETKVSFRVQDSVTITERLD